MLSFDDYVASLGRLTAIVDLTASTPEAEAISEAVASLEELPDVDAASLAWWARHNPQSVHVLGLTVGLGQEKLKAALTTEFGTAGFVTLARKRPAELIAMLDEQFDLLRLLRTQRNRTYTLADVLIARAGPRATASGDRRRAAGSRTRSRRLQPIWVCRTRSARDSRGVRGVRRRPI